MSKVIGVCNLHYGAPYLRYAIQSIIDYVEEMWIVYTPLPSHGTRTDLACPDSAPELLTECIHGAGDKLRWREGFFGNEAAHRGAIFEHAPDADVIMVLDSDEVWKTDQLERLITEASKGDARNYCAYEMPFWRSFHRAMPERLCAPVRAINVRSDNGNTRYVDAFFSHMGYAQPTKYIDYKMRIHGHIADWRPEWYVDKWLANAQADVHPTNLDFWYAQTVDPLDYLPEFMMSHPFAHMEVIK